MSKKVKRLENEVLMIRGWCDDLAQRVLLLERNYDSSLAERIRILEHDHIITPEKLALMERLNAEMGEHLQVHKESAIRLHSRLFEYEQEQQQETNQLTPESASINATRTQLSATERNSMICSIHGIPFDEDGRCPA